jgi:hypothetical protein
MSESQLKEMAAANPKLFYKATGLTETRPQDNFQAPPRTQVNSDAFLPSGNNTSKDAKYFKDLYKDSPSQYWSPKVQNQIINGVKEGRFTLDDII